MQPLYDPEAVRPMWEELAQCGVTPLNSPCLNRPFGRPLFQAAQVESRP